MDTMMVIGFSLIAILGGAIGWFIGGLVSGRFAYWLRKIKK